jgi:hypothetical protein
LLLKTLCCRSPARFETKKWLLVRSDLLVLIRGVNAPFPFPGPTPT